MSIAGRHLAPLPCDTAFSQCYSVLHALPDGTYPLNHESFLKLARTPKKLNTVLKEMVQSVQRMRVDLVPQSPCKKSGTQKTAVFLSLRKRNQADLTESVNSGFSKTHCLKT